MTTRPAANADLTALVRTMPFMSGLDIEILSGDKNGAVGRAPWAADRTTFGDVLHGGYLMALADSVGALVAVLNLPEGAGTSTIESKTNFFRPLTSGDVNLTATLVHGGKTTIVVQTDITNDAGKLVTRTTQTQAVLASF